jgi:hypothetical protein
MSGFRSSEQRFGFYVSIITATITVITFGIAVCTPPLSGPFCKGDCLEYPYHDIISRFPRDYYWMFPAILSTFFYMMMMISVQKVVPGDKKLFSNIGSGFAVISTLLLSLDYFVQLSFIQPGLLAGETEGIAALSQYNPHGLFIIIEELGFITMNISFFCLVPVFSGSGRLERSLRLIFITSFILMLLSLAAVLIIHGIFREYRFEVIIISITWVELIAAGIIFSRYFKSKISDQSITTDQ